MVDSPPSHPENDSRLSNYTSTTRTVDLIVKAGKVGLVEMSGTTQRVYRLESDAVIGAIVGAYLLAVFWWICEGWIEMVVVLRR
jgi:hypothetical protein